MDKLEKVANGVGKAIEVAPRLYDDALSETAKETGGLIARIPRAINAAFAPLDIWIAKKEYNVKETKILLEKKLKNKELEDIVTPEPYIAVPAIQGISYCSNSDELRNMYASLLANSMDVNMKDSVHPAFVEIIKQLSPFDAKLLKDLSKVGLDHPVAKVRSIVKDTGRGVDMYSNVIGEKYGVTSENIDNYSVALENLSRLKILYISYDTSYADVEVYKDIDNSEVVTSAKELVKLTRFNDIKVIHGIMEFTSFGQSFVKICINE